jgi:predicted nuclease of predicted toxin-antitoxin system
MRFATDENFDQRIVDGLLQRFPDLDTVRVQDTFMFQSKDPDLLGWLAEENRILLTHDIQTMPDFAYERVSNEMAMPGVVIVPRNTPIGYAINELELLIGAGEPEDFENQVQHIRTG